MLTAPTAVGTDLLYAAATKSVGTLAHTHGGNVDWAIVRRLASGSIPGAALGLYLLYSLGIGTSGSRQLITMTLGFALVLSAMAVAARPWIRHLSDRHAATRRHWAGPATVVGGFILGVIVTISSVGAGALGMTLLVLLYPSVRLVRLVGSDVAHAVPLTLIAGLGHLALGSVDWLLLLSLLVGSVPGIMLGSRVSSRLPEPVLRPVLALVLVAVGGQMLTR